MHLFVPTVIIDMNMVTKIGKQVWPWEVPVLQAKYGESKVRVQGVSEVEVKELPNVGEEFARLRTCHGSDAGEGGTNFSYVDLAYGRGQMGLKELEKEMKASTTKPAKKKKASKKPKPAPETEQDSGDGEGDPLGE